MLGYNKTDLLKVLKEVEKHNAITCIYVEVYTTIVDVLKKFDGKIINRRLETALKKDSRLAGYHIHYETRSDLYYINFWGNGLDYENRNHVLLGYVGTNDILNMEYVLDHNRGFLMGKVIDTTTLSDKVSRWNTLIDEFESFIRGPASDISFILTRG